MKKKSYSILILLFLIVFNSFGQEEKWDFTNPNGCSCYVLQIFEKNNTNDSLTLNPFLNHFGAFIIRNGVYNFKVNGTKYSLYKVDSISVDEVFISSLVDSTKTASFNLQQEIILNIISLDNGRAGWPRETMSTKNYNFAIKPQERFCVMPIKKICINDDCSKSFISKYRYMTARSFGKPIFYDNGKWYMQDVTKIYPLNP
ncbi:MAG: hypothetical protein ACOH2V_14010 [Candidatus Saccharimonadaceae bacterium]